MAAANTSLFVRADCSAMGLGAAYGQSRFHAMGTSVHLIVGEAVREGVRDGDSDGVRDGSGLRSGTSAVAAEYLDYARQRIGELEARLSRFLPDSELCQLNRLAGFPTVVSPELFVFVAAAWRAKQLTGGSFDPTLGAPLRQLGYDRTFDEVAASSQARLTADTDNREFPVQWGNPEQSTAVAGNRFDIDPQCRTVTCSPDVQLDLGGIAKGMTADIIAEELVQRGAVGACVNLGGDVRVHGLGPKADGGWSINLMLPGAESERTISLAAGGVCTSAITERRWVSKQGQAHHIVDPDTGRSVRTDLRSSSVVGRTAAAAEVLATAALVDGQSLAIERIQSKGATGILITGSGEVIELPGFDNFSPGSNTGSDLGASPC